MAATTQGHHGQQQPAIPIKPSGRLERAAGPDTTLQEMGFKDVNIQTYGAAPSVANGSTGVPPAPAPLSASKQRPSSSSAQQRPSSVSKHRCGFCSVAA